MRLLLPTLLLPAAALAGGFDGTWKTNMESLKTTGKPLVLLLAGGEYTCSSCSFSAGATLDGRPSHASSTALRASTSAASAATCGGAYASPS